MPLQEVLMAEWPTNSSFSHWTLIPVVVGLNSALGNKWDRIKVLYRDCGLSSEKKNKAPALTFDLLTLVIPNYYKSMLGVIQIAITMDLCGFLPDLASLP